MTQARSLALSTSSALLGALLLAGCPGAKETPPAPAPSPTPAPSVEPAKTEPTAPPPPPPPAWRVLKKGTTVEFKGQKRPFIYSSHGWIGIDDYDLRVRPTEDAPKSGEVVCKKNEVKGLVLTVDEAKPDAFGNTPVRYVLYFQAEAGSNGGPVSGEDEKFMNQGYENNLFALEIDVGKPNTPTEVLDLNAPIGWRYVRGFAVYSDGAWTHHGIRAKPGSWLGPKSDDPNAIKLPQGYVWK